MLAAPQARALKSYRDRQCSRQRKGSDRGPPHAGRKPCQAPGLCVSDVCFFFERIGRVVSLPSLPQPGPRMAAIGLEQEGPGEGASAIVHKQVRGHDCMLASIRVRACVAVGACRLS